MPITVSKLINLYDFNINSIGLNILFNKHPKRFEQFQQCAKSSVLILINVLRSYLLLINLCVRKKTYKISR